MKITYDPYADAMYLNFSSKDIADTTSADKDIIIDYDKNKIPVGMEILSISQKTSPKTLGSINFELNTEKPTAFLGN